MLKILYLNGVGNNMSYKLTICNLFGMLIVLLQMGTYARNGENPPDGFLCPTGGWEVLVKYYVAGRRGNTEASCFIRLNL